MCSLIRCLLVTNESIRVIDRWLVARFRRKIYNTGHVLIQSIISDDLSDNLYVKNFVIQTIAIHRQLNTNNLTCFNFDIETAFKIC